MASCPAHARAILLVVLIVTVASACSGLPFAVLESESTPVPSSSVPRAVNIPETPPAVVAYYPLPGQEIAPNAAVIELRFDRAMNHGSVEAALQVTPEVGGDITWLDERTLQFHSEGLAPETRYQVTLQGAALSADGKTLGRPFSVAFSTMGPLEVTDLSPQPDADELRGDMPLVISFNRPVVPLNCVGETAGVTAECFALPLTITPEIGGVSKWVNTSVYQFIAAPGWDSGRRYSVGLEPSFSSVDGATLDERVTWAFTTAMPKVMTTFPPEESVNQPLEAAVRVDFNTPMDSVATAGAFAMRDSAGEPVPGTFDWADGGAQLVFTPTQLLALGTRYGVSLGIQAKSRAGMRLEVPNTWAFTTVPYPEPIAISPDDGARNVALYEPVRIGFQGAISETTLLPRVVITPNVASAERYTYLDGEVFHVSWKKAPRTRYCVQVRPGVQDRYGNATTQAVTSCFTTGDEAPLLSPATALGAITLDASQAPRLYFLVRNLSRATFRLNALDERGFVTDRADVGVARRTWSESYQNAPNAVSVAPVTLTSGGGSLAPGYYRLSWEVPDNSVWRNALLLAVVDRHVMLKMSSNEALVWVTDLRSGEPTAFAEVHLVDENGTLLGAGMTDGDGLVRIRVNPLADLWGRIAAITGEPGAPGFGVGMSQWDQGASPWDFGISAWYSDFNPYRLYLHSDRPVYRPGQTVRVRGVLREDNDVRFTLPDTERTVALTLRDPDWRVVLTRTAELSDLGVFDTEFDFPLEARLGSYSVQATVPGATPGPYGPWQWTLALTVEAYRKPEFEVTVVPERPEVLQGETIRALVEAKTFFGAPVANARVSWEVRSEPVPFDPSVAGWWTWSTADGGEFGELIASGEVRTDRQGRWLLELPADLPLGERQLERGSQRWTIEATVVDESTFPVSGRTDVIVHAARFYLGLSARSWVLLPGEPATVDALALDWHGLAVAEQTITAKLAERAWKARPSIMPFVDETWDYTDTVISTFNVTTNLDGAAELVVTAPKGGPYVLIAEARDVDGHIVRAETALWVSGPEGAAWRLPEGRITPVADARAYRPGDVAEILLPTPFEGPFQVLMTVERGGVLQVRRFVAQSANPTVTLPILEAFAPNVYVSFVLVNAAPPDAEGGAPDVRVGWVALTVEPVAQTLTVELEPSALPPYSPGTEVALTVRTLDAMGRAVDADVGLAVVDKAVLTLASPNTPSILEGFYGERALGVRTGNSLLTLYSRLASSLEKVAANADRLALELTAGGLGGGGNGAPEQVEVRQDFPDTAFWEAHLRTGLKGEAEIVIPLPDSVTTWVVDARAVTADTRVGEAQVDWVVSKPLIVRPVTPRFFIAGDRAEVAALVNNSTSVSITAEVTLTASGGVRTDSETTQQVTIPAGGQVRVTWQVEALEGARAALLTFSAEGGGYSDRARPAVAGSSDGALPIYSYTSPDTYGAFGVLEGADTRVEALFVPAEAASGSGTVLHVQVEPSLAGSLVGGLRYLDTPRYDSTEMLVSRFLLNVLTVRTLREAGVSGPELESKLQVLVPDALDRLYGRQADDGGWTWGANTPADLQLSAYVGLGLWEAQAAGYAVRADALEGTLGYLEQVILKESLRVPRQWTPNHALAVYVLALAGRLRPGGAGEALFVAREQLGITGQGYLALALERISPGDAKVVTLLEGLRGSVERSATGARWEEQDTRYWVTDVRATAVVLTALLHGAPEDPLIPQAVRWLLVARQGDRWATTQETAWALVALTDYLVMSGELRPDYAWVVSFNGETLGSGDATVETLWETPSWTIGLDGPEAAGLVSGRVNALEIGRGEGSGRLSYSAHLALEMPVAEVKAGSRGITVQREYCRVEGPASLVGQAGSCEPVNAVRVGDLVKVQLTVIVPKTRYFVMLEDPYPAGLEAANLALLTEPQRGGTGVLLADDMWRLRIFDYTEYRDERAVFFSRALPAGTHQVNYWLRAVFAGEFRVLPAVAFETYFPEVWGRTAGTLLSVQR